MLPSPAPRAVLFDLDGTLVDSYPAIAASVNHVRGLHALEPLPVDEVKRHVGRGPNYLLAHTVNVGDNDANVAAYKAHHPSVLRAGTRLLPGAGETLRTLHQRGVRLGVCSNKPLAFTRELLAILDVASVFDLVLGPEDVARPKPAPDMLLKALQRLGIAADEVLYIGDMTVDIDTGRAAGVRAWIVPTGSDTIETLERARPERLLRDLHELAALLS